MVAIGGAAFMRFALLPAATEALGAEEHERLRSAMRKRWARVVMICIALLFLTGAANFVMLAVPPKIEAIPYHPIFGLKVLAAFGVFFLASALAGRSPGLARMRQDPAKWYGILLGLALLIVLLSVILGEIRSQSPAPVAPPTVASPG